MDVVRGLKAFFSAFVLLHKTTRPSVVSYTKNGGRSPRKGGSGTRGCLGRHGKALAFGNGYFTESRSWPAAG